MASLSDLYEAFIVCVISELRQSSAAYANEREWGGGGGGVSKVPMRYLYLLHVHPWYNVIKRSDVLMR